MCACMVACVHMRKAHLLQSLGEGELGRCHFSLTRECHSKQIVNMVLFLLSCRHNLQPQQCPSVSGRGWYASGYGECACLLAPCLGRLDVAQLRCGNQPVYRSHDTVMECVSSSHRTVVVLADGRCWKQGEQYCTSHCLISASSTVVASACSSSRSAVCVAPVN